MLLSFNLIIYTEYVHFGKDVSDYKVFNSAARTKLQKPFLLKNLKVKRGLEVKPISCELWADLDCQGCHTLKLL